MIVDGNKIAKILEEKLVTELLFSTPKKVCFIIIGGNAATEQFVKSKSLVALRVGISAEVKRYSDIKTTEEAVSIVQKIGDMDYDGIVVQLPLIKGIDTQTVLDAVPPMKDIDVLGTVAKESYEAGKINRTPPVAQAVYEILKSCDINLNKKNIVIIGRGRLVGKPVHQMLTRMKISHRIIDKDTEEGDRLTLLKNADVVISGVGISHSIKPEMIKRGVVLIDAGTSEQGGDLVGDIDPECAEKASFMTPVPGGVGPVTIISLLRNLL